MLPPIKNLKRYPVGNLLQGFGENPELFAIVGLKGHPGIDLFAPKDTPIVACFDGWVDQVQPNPNATHGMGVTLRADAEGDIQLEAEYNHFSSVNVVLKQRVKAGDIIGIIGNTGFVYVGNVPYWYGINPSGDGTHLHFGIRVYRKKSDGYFYPEKDVNDGLRGCVNPLIYFMTRQSPVEGKLGFRFGEMYPNKEPFFSAGLTGKKHLGQDILCPTGSVVAAPEAGEVLETANRPQGGLMVVLRGVSGQIHRLMHNSEFLVKSGRVELGQAVALSGNTGLSSLPHLHWDISTIYPVNTNKFNNFIDPLKWLGDEMVSLDNARGIAYGMYKTLLGREPESETVLNNHAQFLKDALNTGNQKKVNDYYAGFIPEISEKYK